MATHFERSASALQRYSQDAGHPTKMRCVYKILNASQEMQMYLK
jgi:hypothetical protein